MSKSSTVTVREKPVEDVASATSGGLTIHGETIVISTDSRVELVDLTKQIMEFARKFNIRMRCHCPSTTSPPLTCSVRL